MMKRFSFLLLVIGFFGLSVTRGDMNVQTAQSRLKQSGFYFGDPTGVYDDETAAAVTRYQIRHGLAISGKLDAATAKALGVSARAGEAAPVTTSGTWRRLRNGDMQFLRKLNAGDIPPPGAPAERPPARSPAPATQRSEVKPPVPPPTPREETRSAGSPPQPPAERRAAPASQPDYGDERLRDYVAAFVLAGLDPKVGAELEFFADRVNYFGEPNVGRKKIQRDLVRYDREWPQRRFWLAGDLEVINRAGGELKVTFPLRYELRSDSKQASGKMMKTLTLQKTDDGNLAIVAVNERKG